MEEAPIAEVPSLVSEKEERRFKISDLRRFWWVVPSFVLPYIAVFCLNNGFDKPTPSTIQMKQQTITIRPHTPDHAANLALRSGVIGLAAALLIVLFWRLDALVAGAHPKSADVKEDILLVALATTLWMMWMGTSHVVLLAADEIQIEDALPGFYVQPGNSF